MKGEELLNSISQKSAELDSYLSKAISFSYKNKMLICNPVISRNPFSSSLLTKIGSQQKCEETQSRGRGVSVKLIAYYLKSFAQFFFFLTHFIAFKLSTLRFNQRLVDKSKDLVIIDTFTMIDKIYPKGKFDDSYFGSLFETMNKRNRQYVVLCFLFGDRPWNLKRRIQTYNILANDGRNFVTEFELLRLWDWFDLLKFVLMYPLATLELIRQEFGEFDRSFRREVVNTLDSVQFPNYIRYLVGRKLASLTDQKLKVISWYENQVIDMLLVKGIRDSGIDSKIYGCQFYVKYPLFANLYPLAEEAAHNVLPDVTLVSGKYYLSENPSLNIKLGISPRYNYLFDIELDKDTINRRDGLLVLLTYDIAESNRIIELAEDCQIRSLGYEIAIKLHPNHLLGRPFSYPEAWKYTEEHLSKLCLRSSLMITSGSGSALESAAMGCSVIIVGNNKGLTFNPMPEYGKGNIWDIVFDAEELKQSIDRLGRYRSQNPNEIVGMANELKDMFFTEATEQKYVELFDL